MGVRNMDSSIVDSSVVNNQTNAVTNRFHVNVESRIRNHREELIMDVSRFLSDIGLGGMFKKRHNVHRNFNGNKLGK